MDIYDDIDDATPNHYPADFVVIPDDGCDLAPSCLRCPLPRCRYDDPSAARRWRRAGRTEAIATRFLAGEHADTLAERFGVSRRTVYRAVAESREHYQSQRKGG